MKNQIRPVDRYHMKNQTLWIIGGIALLATVGLGGLTNMTIQGNIIDRIAEAIATAEGYYVTGSRPNRNNNPGDLTLDLTGKAVGKDGMFIVYATPQDGFDALKRQVSLMFNGSHIYSAGMSIERIAQLYSPDGYQEWADNVANTLGVSTDTPLNQVS